MSGGGSEEGQSDPCSLSPVCYKLDPKGYQPFSPSSGKTGWGARLQTLNLRTLQGLQTQSPYHQKHTGIGTEVVAPSQRTGPRSVFVQRSN